MGQKRTNHSVSGATVVRFGPKADIERGMFIVSESAGAAIRVPRVESQPLRANDRRAVNDKRTVARVAHGFRSHLFGFQFEKRSAICSAFRSVPAIVVRSC